MKKRLLIYWLCIISASAFSQSVELKVTNPMPRIGESLYLNYEINPEKTDLQKSVIDITTQEKKSASPFKSCTDPDYSIAKGSISLTKKLDKIGTINLGPFSFVIDGKTYKSGNMAITVYPELPKEKNGVWISYIKAGNDYYLIIEQRIEGKDQSLYSSKAPSLVENDKTYVKVDDSLSSNKLESEIKFLQQSSSLGMKSLDNNMKKEESLYVQKITVYKVWTSDKYKNNFLLSREHLLNLPTNSDFTPILMKK